MCTWKTIYLSSPPSPLLLQIFSTRNNSRNNPKQLCYERLALYYFQITNMIHWKIHKYPNPSKGGGELSPFFHQAKTLSMAWITTVPPTNETIYRQPIDRPYNMKICTGKQRQVRACAYATTEVGRSCESSFINRSQRH